MQCDDAEIFRNTEMQFTLGEEEEPIEIKPRRKGVQTFETEYPAFEMFRRHNQLPNFKHVSGITVIYRISSIALRQYHFTALDIVGCN